MAQGQSDSIQFILIHMKYYTLKKKRKSSSRSCTQPRGLEWPGLSYLPTRFLFLYARARQRLKGVLALPIDRQPRITTNWMRMEMTDRQRLILQRPLAIGLFKSRTIKEKALSTAKLCSSSSPGQSRYLGKSYGSFSLRWRLLQRAPNSMWISSSIPIYTEIRYKILSSF